MKNKCLIYRKHEERNKDMARGKHGSNNNLNGNKQDIQVKTGDPTVLKLILTFVHSQLEIEERVSESKLQLWRL